MHFVLVDAFTPEMVEALKSGIEISFRADVVVVRVHRNWFDETVGESRVDRSVRYDALARVYRLNRGKGEETMREIRETLEGMARYDVAVPLDAPAESGKRYRVSVNVRLDRVGLARPLRTIVFFSSLWDVETGWADGDLRAP